MKTTLKITMLVLTAGLAGVAVTGLLGFTAAAVTGGKIILSAYAYAGAMLVTSSEYDGRRTIRLHRVRSAAPVHATACPAYPVHGACAAA